MPVTPTYPGVYIEELPSGVRTITGVATSIAAFVGRALRGPVNDPITINGFGDFERIFGGLWLNSRLGYALRSFFENGGGQAIVVRLHKKGAAADTAELTHGNLTLMAASPGTWGNKLRIRVDHDVAAGEVFGLPEADRFNLTVRDGGTGAVEVFRNLTMTDHGRRVDRVLAAESALMRFKGAVAGNRPAKHDAKPTDPDELKKFPWGDVKYSAAVSTEAADNGDEDLDAATVIGSEANKTGIQALEKADLFNLLCIPPYKNLDDEKGGDIDSGVTDAAAAYCEKRRAMLLIDAPPGWTTKDQAKSGISSLEGLSKNAAVFFPRLRQPNFLRDGQIETFAPCGAVAGIFARTDVQRGVWKAPAGLEATLVGVPELAVNLTDPENGELNPLGINCLRVRPAAGRVVWGSRTRVGDDRTPSEWKYIPVRRTALFLEESLYRGTQWVVFEPNDEPLWAQIRLNIGAFLHSLFRQGAFQGKSPQEAYFVRCDKTTTTQNDIDSGIVNIVVGFAPLKPAEFVIIKLQQIAGQLAA
ncbi:MAG TPA: phage tail sheath subtilisin-like domain-containing protein [Thermoanaerobaculia bacterium]|nr:phage tail sheath subtilisin-like domain-containing protein [Thermoanaerobaculia bacterium]